MSFSRNGPVFHAGSARNPESSAVSVRSAQESGETRHIFRMSQKNDLIFCTLYAILIVSPKFGFAKTPFRRRTFYIRIEPQNEPRTTRPH